MKKIYNFLTEQLGKKFHFSWIKDYYQNQLYFKKHISSLNGSRPGEYLSLSHFSCIEIYPKTQIREVLAKFQSIANLQQIKSKDYGIDYSKDQYWNKLAKELDTGASYQSYNSHLDFIPKITNSLFKEFSIKTASENSYFFKIEYIFIPTQETCLNFSLLINNNKLTEIQYPIFYILNYLVDKIKIEPIIHNGFQTKKKLVSEFRHDLNNSIYKYITSFNPGLTTGLGFGFLTLERYTYRENPLTEVSNICNPNGMKLPNLDYYSIFDSLFNESEKNYQKYYSSSNSLKKYITNISYGLNTNSLSLPIQIISEENTGIPEHELLYLTYITYLSEILLRKTLEIENQLIFEKLSIRRKNPNIKEILDLQKEQNLIELLSEILSIEDNRISKYKHFTDQSFETILMFANGDERKEKLINSYKLRISKRKIQLQIKIKKIKNLLNTFSNNIYTESNFNLQESILTIAFVTLIVTILFKIIDFRCEIYNFIKKIYY
ncbi:Hypothetical protein LBF_2152 [Leptospira biflexa serovar Patoc strain 'Patoc 1 (Ames)']|uniref:Uncharacterized protein n=1 Tax=Leptospira biflexa serovar Patoc (strain Patoc 1 / ATCC 23582 / Paris) TaxID=456481 RepID=B0ST72_LEPBP|nr:hypothetical protein [Leptospira biflexa]ABZ94649.1 Hypothetical protein LBF_2152 [Leptospira biflexa serovar Patoc strain 'Patoc 1 (Ames)']ABZ98312.1 Hypothetical protein LEPBI_I2214 [Leptospira biflexa serovar Patoc strain 'Patoc 1 (Paris)']